MPYEDTQLAFYAALVAAEGRPTKAIYLAVDGTRELKAVPHPNVEAQRRRARAGPRRRLAPAAGGRGAARARRGPSCEYCDARGLCRRDHWTREVAS